MHCPSKVALLCLAFATAHPASAQTGAKPAAPQPAAFSEAAVNSTDTAVLKPGTEGPAALRAQVLLDRAGFSPGVIDGKYGGLSLQAARAFQAANKLPVTGNIGPQTWALLQRDDLPALVRLAVSANDASGPYVANIPEDMNAKAKLPALHYTNAMEAMAEKFHTTPAFLKRLNPGLTQVTPGAAILVPNVRGTRSMAPEGVKVAANAAPRPMRDWGQVLNELSIPASQPKATRVVVDKSDKAVRVFGESDRLLAYFPATIGSEKDPLPLGTWKINGVAKLPPYNYNPKLFWDAEADDKKAKLPPGPNSPVGVVWIDLSKPHYGIHGTPEPANISRSESHGCIRLTNWDAARVAQMVSPGIPAILQE
jgi:lipoprotein-anchoring transpeptidase ErfK/SrfK